MNEYQEAYRVSQLLGAPQGYVGYGEGSQLIDALRANPRTVVLFDEIEKAHPDILKTLMNAMEDGNLSTASGGRSQSRVIDCKKSIFIFTSNIDCQGILDELQDRNAFGDVDLEDEVCRRRLRACDIPAEIVGRIGRFLVFGTLTSEVRAVIITQGISEVAAEYGLTITRIDPEIVISVMQQARSESFGIRPERSLIDHAFGGLFADAASNQWRVVSLKANPPRCEPSEIAPVAGNEVVEAVSPESEEGADDPEG
jgi:ATP-dependent Clp protease ATP-binding subunit ClpA